VVAGCGGRPEGLLRREHFYYAHSHLHAEAVNGAALAVLADADAKGTSAGVSRLLIPPLWAVHRCGKGNPPPPPPPLL